MAEAQITVANFDIPAICDRLTRWASEFRRCSSAGVAEFNEHDQKRAKDWMDYLRELIEMIAKPDSPLDMPQTHPGVYPIQPFITDDLINAVENLVVKDIIWRWKALWLEASGSQSKDRASGLIKVDEERLLAIIENCEGVIEKGSRPIDMPENPQDTGPSPA